jgi:hypothetical protein
MFSHLAFAAGRDVVEHHLLAVKHSKLPDSNDCSVDLAPVLAAATCMCVDPMNATPVHRRDLTDHA